MWREFFGKDARIIGVELNPEAIKWREHGFEIFIGDQSDPRFWVDFFLEVGDINVLLDDGGHQNDQQIVTVKSALPHVLDGGQIIIEDTQTSFMKFESFKRYSFVSYLQNRIKSLYARSDELNLVNDIFSKSIHSLEFLLGCAYYTSIENYVPPPSELKIVGIEVTRVIFDITLTVKCKVYCVALTTGYLGTI